ncbi:MAG TPA: hypothetical protein EYN93_05715 [Planctomycetaceae bacterium]|nr:hypothetical protein [Planctomycetaceae bacterium]
MTSNVINIIIPYKWEGTWVFDDERVGLQKEPFVAGADVMIDHLVQDIPNAANGFRLFFSAYEFPRYTVCIEWRREDGSGNIYYSPEYDLEGWLCPALLRYFDKPPEKIYVKAEGK